MLVLSLNKWHVCRFSTTLLNMCDIKDVGYDELVAWMMTWPLFSETLTDMPADLVVFNQTCLLVHCKSKRKATWLMPLHLTWQITLWNFISQDCYIVNTTYMPCRELLCHCSCIIYAYWPSVTVTKTAAVPTCLLVECCCKPDACWTLATQSACLLTFCHSILHVSWRCASLSAIPAGMVSHYQPCLLVWCLTIKHTCGCGESL